MMQGVFFRIDGCSDAFLAKLGSAIAQTDKPKNIISENRSKTIGYRFFTDILWEIDWMRSEHSDSGKRANGYETKELQKRLE